MRPLYKPREGVCSRGWMFMGEQGGPCDKACQMCYYAHQKNLVFFSYETMLQHANLFRHYYGLDAVDISGGEPTIFKTPTGDIVDLVQHCARIGLKPTLISHGQNNNEKFTLGRKQPLFQAVEEAGLEDWLISLHGGNAAAHDKILCQPGSFDRLVAGIDNLKRPVRFNTTLMLDNKCNLPVNVLLDRPPTVWNCIMFNPFHYWSDKTGKTEIDFQVSYRDSAAEVAAAIEKLEKAGWECNVRYWPLCIAKEFGFAKNVCGYHQVPFDPWEWRLNVTQRIPMERIEVEGGWYQAERNRAAQWMKGRENDVCRGCSLEKICDKPPTQYAEKYGFDELVTQSGAPIGDPVYFQGREG